MRLASGSYDNSVRVWDVMSEKAVCVLKGHTDWVRNIAWDRESQRLASGSDDKSVRVWDVMTGKVVRVLEGHTNSVTSVVWDLESQRLASGSYDMSIRVWDVKSGKTVRVLKGHTSSVISIAWGRESQCLASGSRDHSIRVWDVKSGKAMCVLEGHTGDVNSVAWDRESQRLISGSFDRSIRVWEVSSGKELYRLTLPQAVESIAWHQSSFANLLSVAFGNAVGCFKLTAAGNNYITHLIFLAAPGTTLHLDGVNIAGATGLDPTNYELLQQRGAIGTPAEVKSIHPKEAKNTALALTTNQFGLFSESKSSSQNSSGKQAEAKKTCVIC